MDSNIINKQTKNPWIGLNSYTEGQPLYGRDEEIEVLSSRIQYNTQTVVYGRSGIGKSSILCAGIFPRLRDNNILPIHIRFEHNDKPYIEQIRESLFGELRDKHCVANEVVKRHIDQEGKYLFDESLWEFFHRYEFQNPKGVAVVPLVVIDQFEEIFTLEKDRKKVNDFFVQLADLLNQTKPAYLTKYEETLYMQSSLYEEKVQPAPKSTNKISDLLKTKTRHRTEFNYLEEDNFHIVLTIREDYLSYLERSTTHIPLLKHNRYCLQPINEEQAAEIITQPCPGLVDKATARLIIEKITGETDFDLNGVPEISVDSAVLSLYLSRLYDKKGDESQITPALIEKFGNNIIEDFYTETIANYPSSVIEFLEDALLNNEGHRENISVYNATHGCKELTTEMIDSLANDYKLIRRFSYNDTSRIEFIHDILCPVIKARKDKREQLRQQEDQRRKQEEEKRDILRREAEKRVEIEQKADRERQKVRRRFKISLSLFVSIIVFITLWWVLTQYPYSEQYTTFVVKNGWPVGIKKISGTDKKTVPVHYRLYRKGILPETIWGIHLGNHFTKVEVLNSKDKPVNNILINSPVVSLYEDILSDDNKAQSFAEKQKKVHYWLYLPDQNGNVSRVLAYSAGDTLLYGEQYYYSSLSQPDANNTNNGSVTANIKAKFFNYIDEDGKVLVVRDNGVCKINVLEDSLGYVIGYAFFSTIGAPLYDRNKNYGYLIENDNDGLPQRMYATNEFGDKTHDVSCLPKIIKQDESYFINYATGHTQKFDLLAREKEHTMLFKENGEKYKIAVLYKNNKLWKYKEYKGKILSYEYILDGDEYIEYDSSRERYTWSKNHIKRDKQKIIETFYGGDNQHNVCHPILCYYGYYKSVTARDSISDKNYIVERQSFYGIDGKTLAECHDKLKYNRKETYIDKKSGNIVKYFTYDNHRVINSRKYYYNKKGKVCAQAVISVVDKDTPIRCPRWEFEGLTYYKLKYVVNDYGTKISTEGENELGEKSLVTAGDKMYSHKILPFEESEHEINRDSTIHAEKIYLACVTDITNVHQARAIHMLIADCHLLKLGLKDGDIIISQTSKELRIARYVSAKNKFIGKTIKIDNKQFLPSEDYEIDEFYLTDDEWNRIKHL